MSASGEQLQPIGPIATWRARLSAQLVGNSIGRTLARGAVWSVGANAGGYGLALVVQIVLTRSLGQVQYGNYAYALACMNIALLFAKLELDTCSLRFIGMYQGASRWSLLRGFLQRAPQLVLLSSLGVAAVGAVTVALVGGHLGNGAAVTLEAACLLLPVSAMLELKARSLHAFKKVPESQLPTLIVRPLVFGIGIVVATRVFHLALTAPEAVGLNVVAALIALRIIMGFLRAATPLEARSAPPSFETRQWLRTAAGFLVIGGAQLILGTQMDVVVVGSLLGAADAGLYQVASQLAAVGSLGVTAIIYTALAMISDLHARGRQRELQHLVTMLCRANLLVAIGMVAALLVVGRMVLGWFGPTFPAAYPVLLVLAGSSFIASTIGILAGFLLTLTGHQREAALLVVGSAILNLTLSLIATPMFGAIGTASATAATACLRSGALMLYCWKLLGIRLTPFTRVDDG
jgi:O-antigen/teichoic acid export membrane protein